MTDKCIVKDCMNKRGKEDLLETFARLVMTLSLKESQAYRNALTIGKDQIVIPTRQTS